MTNEDNRAKSEGGVGAKEHPAEAIRQPAAPTGLPVNKGVLQPLVAVWFPTQATVREVADGAHRRIPKMQGRAGLTSLVNYSGCTRCGICPRELSSQLMQGHSVPFVPSGALAGL